MGEWNIGNPFNCTAKTSFQYYQDYHSLETIVDGPFFLSYDNNAKSLTIDVSGLYAKNSKDGEWKISVVFKDFVLGSEPLNGTIIINTAYLNGIPHGDWNSSVVLTRYLPGRTGITGSYLHTEETLSLTFNRGVITGNVVNSVDADGNKTVRRIATDNLGFLHGQWSNKANGSIVETSVYNHGYPVRIVTTDTKTGDSTIKVNNSSRLAVWEKAFPLMLADSILYKLKYESFSVRYDQFDQTIEDMFYNQIVTALGLPGEERWNRERNFKVTYLYEENSTANDLCAIGDYYLAKADTFNALEQYKDCMTRYPSEGIGYYKIGRVAEQLGSADDAILFYSKAVSLNYNLAAFYTGRFQYKLGNDSLALIDLNRALGSGLGPAELAECHFYTGVCYFNTGDCENACTHMDKVISLTTNQVLLRDVCYIIGRCKYDQHDYNSARQNLNYAIQRGTAYLAEAYFYEGLCDLYFSFYNNALTDFGNALTAGYLEPHRVYYLMGVASSRMPDYLRASGFFRKSIELAEYDNALYDYGVLLSQMGKTDSAISMFQRLTIAAPHFASGWNNLGWVYLDTDNFQAASDAFDRAIQLGESADSFTGKLVCLFLTKHKKLARAHYETGRGKYDFLYPPEKMLNGLLRHDYFYSAKQKQCIEECAKKL